MSNASPFDLPVAPALNSHIQKLCKPTEARAQAVVLVRQVFDVENVRKEDVSNGLEGLYALGEIFPG